MASELLSVVERRRDDEVTTRPSGGEVVADTKARTDATAARSDQVYPEPTVGALILNTEGKLFLMRSHKWRGMYVVPGGHVELGERLEDALRREVKEETGLDIRGVEFLQFQEFVFDAAFWKRRHFIFFDYVCRTDSADVTLNDEAQEYVWVAPEEALALPLEPYTVTAIRAYLARRNTDSR